MGISTARTRSWAESSGKTHRRSEDLFLKRIPLYRRGFCRWVIEGLARMPRCRDRSGSEGDPFLEKRQHQNSGKTGRVDDRLPHLLFSLSFRPLSYSTRMG